MDAKEKKITHLLKLLDHAADVIAKQKQELKECRQKIKDLREKCRELLAS